jgi:hypothetical protein
MSKSGLLLSPIDFYQNGKCAMFQELNNHQNRDEYLKHVKEDYDITTSTVNIDTNYGINKYATAPIKDTSFLVKLALINLNIMYNNKELQEERNIVPFILRNNLYG